MVNIHDDLIFLEVCFRSIQWHHDELWMSECCAAPVFLQHGAGFYRHVDEYSHPHLHAPKTDHLETFKTIIVKDCKCYMRLVFTDTFSPLTGFPYEFIHKITQFFLTLMK